MSVSNGARGNIEDSNFATKSFYGNKKSGKDVVSEKFPPLDNLCGINVDNNLDINDINNDSFQDIARFNPELCSSFIEPPPNDSDNGAITDLDNTVQGLVLDQVNDMQLEQSLRKRKRTDFNYSEDNADKDAELSDSGSDTEFVPVLKKPKKHLKAEPAKGYKKKAGWPPGAPNKNKKTVPLTLSTTFENRTTFKKPNHKIHNIKKKTKTDKSEKKSEKNTVMLLNLGIDDKENTPPTKPKNTKKKQQSVLEGSFNAEARGGSPVKKNSKKKQKKGKEPRQVVYQKSQRFKKFR